MLRTSKKVPSKTKHSIRSKSKQRKLQTTFKNQPSSSRQFRCFSTSPLQEKIATDDSQVDHPLETLIQKAYDRENIGRIPSFNPKLISKQLSKRIKLLPDFSSANPGDIKHPVLIRKHLMYISFIKSISTSSLKNSTDFRTHSLIQQLQSDSPAIDPNGHRLKKILQFQADQDKRKKETLDIVQTVRERLQTNKDENGVSLGQLNLSDKEKEAIEQFFVDSRPPLSVIWDGIHLLNTLPPGPIQESDFWAILALTSSVHNIEISRTHPLTGQIVQGKDSFSNFSYSIPIQLHQKNVNLYHFRQLALSQSIVPPNFKPTDPLSGSPTFDDFIHAGSNYDMIRYDINRRVGKGSWGRTCYSYDIFIHIPQWFDKFLFSMHKANAILGNQTASISLQAMQTSYVTSEEKLALFHQIESIANDTNDTINEKKKHISSVSSKLLDPLRFNFRPGSNPHDVLLETHCVTYHEAFDVQIKESPMSCLIPFTKNGIEKSRRGAGLRLAIQSLLPVLGSIDADIIVPDNPFTIKEYNDFVASTEARNNQQKDFYTTTNRPPNLYADQNPSDIDHPIFAGLIQSTTD